MQIQRVFKISCKLSVGILTKTPAGKEKYSSDRCLRESERKGWESPGGDKAALPEAHGNHGRSKDMMSVYRETGQASPGSSGSRILIIHRRKSGIRLPCCSWKSGGQNLHSNRVNLIKQLGSLRGELIVFSKWGRMNLVCRVRPNKVSTCHPQNALPFGSLGHCESLRVGACFAVGCCSVCCVSTPGDVFMHVLGKGGNPHPSSLQYTV